MARIRSIKPDFFTSEDVVSLHPLARILFIATWCEADREGRMRWRPMTLKMRYLPADNCDIEELCGQLIRQKLIVLYEVRDITYAYIPTFTTHQVINNREAASKLPSPPVAVQSPSDDDACGTRDPRVGHAPDTPLPGREGKGREGKERGGEARAPEPTPLTPPGLHSASPPAGDAFRVGKEVATILGVADNPNWFGDYTRITTWLNQGADEELILRVVRRVMRDRADPAPPDSLKYFDKPILRAIAERNAPMPEVKTDARPDARRFTSDDALLAGFGAAADDRTPGSQPVQ